MANMKHGGVLVESESDRQGELYWFRISFENLPGCLRRFDFFFLKNIFDILNLNTFRTYFLRNITVDIFVTALAASDYNFYYRQIQAKEFAEEVKR